jgi:hypothetical protein
VPGFTWDTLEKDSTTTQSWAFALLVVFFFLGGDLLGLGLGLGDLVGFADLLGLGLGLLDLLGLALGVGDVDALGSGPSVLLVGAGVVEIVGLGEGDVLGEVLEDAEGVALALADAPRA